MVRRTYYFVAQLIPPALSSTRFFRPTHRITISKYLARGLRVRRSGVLPLFLGPNFVADNFLRLCPLLFLLIFLLFGRSPLSFENDQREEKYLTQGARDEEVRGPTPPTLDQIRFACASSSEIGHKRIT